MKTFLMIALLAFAVKYFYFDGHYSPSTYSSADWFDGAHQLETATQLARANKAPLLVYVYADWCGYCKKFEKELLYTSQISSDLQRVVKVRMNPDKDGLAKVFEKENALTGYPTVLLKSSAESPFKPLFPFTRGSNLMSASEFVRAVRGRDLIL